MKLIVGLGNPGKKYENSRHNVGFMVVDELARKFQISNFKFQIDKKANAEIIKTSHGGEEIVLAKPQVFMNASGFAVAKLCSHLAIEQFSNLWVIHDDLDLPLGKIKIVQGRGSAGHHGIESIIRELGTADFVRFRLGVGHPLKGDEWYVSQGGPVDKNVKHKEVEEYVLEEFSGKDRVEAGKMIKKAAEAIEISLEKGIEQAENQLNLK